MQQHRTVLTYTMHLNGTPEQVFPLLCPVQEYAVTGLNAEGNALVKGMTQEAYTTLRRVLETQRA